MKRLLVLTCLALVASVAPAAAAVAELTVTVSPAVATAGDAITVAGTIPADAEPGQTVDIARSDGASSAPIANSPATVVAGAFSVSDVIADPGTYTYTVSWAGDTTYDPGQVTSTSVLVLPPSTMTIDVGPSAINVGQTVDISGAITDPASVSGASIVIEVSSDGTTFTPIADSPAVTDGTGAFGATDVPPLGTYTYRASWEGDGTTYGSASATSQTTVDVSKWAATLTLKAPATSVYGHSFTLSGTWSSGGGGGAGGSTVTIVRAKSGGGTKNLLAKLKSGAYKLTDTPPSTGTFTYTASWAGDATHSEASSSSVEVVVSKRSTALTLDVTRSRVTYGDTTTLIATMKRGDPGSAVRFEKRVSGSWTSIGTEPVKDGVARLKVAPRARQMYRAVFDATANLKASASDVSTVEVRPIMQSRMIGTFTRDGKYAVYACCTAYFYVKLKPIHPRLSWNASVQYYGRNAWRPLGSDSYRFDANGGSGIYLSATAGYRYRVRGHFAGDGDHLSATSAWNYFSFNK